MEYNYKYQSEANILSLVEDTEYGERKEGLLTIVNRFEEAGIHWALACSANLFLRGIVDEFHDLDLVVDARDISKIEEIMKKENAILKETGGNGFCESDTFLGYQLKRVDIDVISGFRVITFGTKFLYNFNEAELDFIELEGKKIPLISMEALYLLYAMMEGWQAKRRYKRLLIEEYLIKSELEFSQILTTALEEDMPGWIKRKIKEIVLSKKENL